MDLFDALHASSAGLSVQRLRMNLISANLANAQTTRTREGGPYRRREVVLAAQPAVPAFRDVLRAQRDVRLPEVRALKVFEDSRPPVRKYDPHHPDADAEGYVAYPNVSLMEEMVNMMNATRSYEANIAAVRAAKEMAMKALEIGR